MTLAVVFIVIMSTHCYPKHINVLYIMCCSICFSPPFLLLGQTFLPSEHNLQLPSPECSVVITHMEPALSLLETPRKCSPLAAETLVPFELLNQLKNKSVITR